jgi:hypothetical protein
LLTDFTEAGVDISSLMEEICYTVTGFLRRKDIGKKDKKQP